jgi:hypothetical protein
MEDEMSVDMREDAILRQLHNEAHPGQNAARTDVDTLSGSQAYLAIWRRFYLTDDLDRRDDEIISRGWRAYESGEWGRNV